MWHSERPRQHIPQDTTFDSLLSAHRCPFGAAYLCEDFATSIRMLLDGLVDADTLVTSTFALEDAATAFATSGTPGQVKVLVTLSE